MELSLRQAPLLRSRATRRRIRRLVMDLDRARGGALAEPLRRALGDAALELAFRVAERDEWVDALGRRVELPVPGAGRTVTFVQGPAGPLAALIHDARLGRDRRLLEATAAAARLALENERLEVELRARIEEVRASRARLVASGDAERRRIERDLHDGAQQRLVSLALGLQMVLMRLGDSPDPRAITGLEHGLAVAVEAIEELRRIAHGIFPAALTEEGLAAALDELAAAAPIGVELAATPDRRIDEPAEAAAYFAAVEAIATAADDDPGAKVRLAARLAGDLLELTVEPQGASVGDLRSLELEDRVDAVGGTVTTEAGRLRVQIPTGGDRA